VLNASIRKHLPGFTVDINLSFDNGILVLFGPSGSGKSTILNLSCWIAETIGRQNSPQQSRVFLQAPRH